MPEKITHITEEQSARFPEWVDKWVKVGLCTETADFDKAKFAVQKAYDVCGLNQPKHIMSFSSPLALVYGGVMILKMMPKLPDQAELADRLRAEVNSCVLRQESTYDEMLKHAVLSKNDRAYQKQCTAQRKKITPQFLRDSLSNLYQGQFWASWAAYISFFRDVMDWENPVLDRFKIDEDLVTSCGYVWWHKDLALISDRPQTIHQDEQGRLHCETGPAISYRDGWNLWHWHGVSVPKEWITAKHTLSPTQALTWPQIEQRRVACEIVGWHNILDQLNGRVINEDTDPQIGSLVEVTLPDAGIERFLRVRCGTGRDFAIPVPPDQTTALGANAWIYDIPENLLKSKEWRT